LDSLSECDFEIGKRNLNGRRHIDQCAQSLDYGDTVDLFDIGRRRHVSSVEDHGFGDRGTASERLGHCHMESGRHNIRQLMQRQRSLVTVNTLGLILAIP
jgi:hypothetical protein